jgi:tyrosyl-tRNA synthetase
MREMDTAERLRLIMRNTDEVLTPEELDQALHAGKPLKHYIGFEISGKVHLGTGLASAAKVADFQKAGVKCSYFLATWHAWINNKLGGDLDTIRGAAAYFEEGLKAGLLCMGGDPEKAAFIHADKLYHGNDEYWRKVVEVSKHVTLNRATRATSILGRQNSGEMPLAWLIYTPMQVADCYEMGVTLAHAGMDQRKAHVVAREVAHAMGVPKPVAVHHHLLLGLQKPPIWPIPKERLAEVWSQVKMSKSVGGSAIFVTDSPEDIRKKVTEAFCDPGNAEYNPLLDWAKHLIFARDKAVLAVKRPAKFGGDVTYTDYAALEGDFAGRKLHPMDLKNAMAEALIKLLEPARKHFARPKNAKLAAEMEKLVITR